MADRALGSGEDGYGEFLQLNDETEWMGELRLGGKRGDERNESEEE